MVTESLTASAAVALVDFLAKLDTSARYTVGQRIRGSWPRLNKLPTLEEYREQTDRTEDLCCVEKVLVLSREEWIDLADSLLSDDPRFAGLGGHNSDAALPEGWEYHTAPEAERREWESKAYRCVTVVLVADATDDSDTFFVDPQGYSYARYVGFPVGAPLPNRDRPRLRLVPPPLPEPVSAPVPVEVIIPALPVGVEAPESIRSIEAASIPAPIGQPVRGAGQKERTKRIRQVLKAAGIRGGVSVTMARGAGCYQTDVRIDGIQHAPDVDWNKHEYRECPVCMRNAAADRRVSAIILGAIPDLDDRSDSQTDHFDFMFTVSVR